jgi:hypothetical protein
MRRIGLYPRLVAVATLPSGDGQEVPLETPHCASISPQNATVVLRPGNPGSSPSAQTPRLGIKLS